MLGAGLAGVFFTAGITFASLALSGRTASGNKQQMQPLLVKQEEALTYDDQIEDADETRKETGIFQPEKTDRKVDADLDTQTGINQDFPHIEINEDSSQSDIDYIQSPENLPLENAKLLSNSAETSNENKDIFPSNEDSSLSHTDIILGSENIENVKLFVNSAENGNKKFTQDVNDVPVPPTSFPIVTEYSEYDDDNNFPSINDDMTSCPLDPATEHESTQNISDHSELFSVNTDISTHINDRQEGNPADIDDPLVSYEPSTPTLVIIESSDITDSLDNSKEMVNIPSSVSGKEIFDHSDISSTVPSEIIVPNLDQNEAFVLPVESNPVLGNNAPSIEYSDVVLADPNSSKPDIPTYSHIGKSSAFESLFNENLNSYASIPAPSISAVLQVRPGKILVPAFVDQVQGQALAALQVLKVIEPDAQPGDLCTRREYARWLVTASSALSRNTGSKVYPAMYIENVTELAFNDITPEDPDYSCIQGLAEAGMISSKLSNTNLDDPPTQQQDSFFFSPESPVTRQDLVSWKMALEKRRLPEVDRYSLYQYSGYIDIDKIHRDAWPALVADLAAGEQGIITLAFGNTRLFQPNKPVTKAQAAIALATGEASEVVGEELTRIEAESLAENIVNTHTALVEQVEKEVNANFESELAKEREKTTYLEKLAEEARVELEKLKAEEEEQNKSLLRKQAAVESEMEVLSKLRHEVEEQLQDLLSNKVEISFEKDRTSQLRKEAESENQMIVQLQYELEIEKKALTMARLWAEEEAKKAREHAKALEVARNRWEKHGIKVIVDDGLKEDASTGVPWLTASEQQTLLRDESVNRAESMVKKLKLMSSQMKAKSSKAVERMIELIKAFITYVKGLASKASKQAAEMKGSIAAKAGGSVEQVKENASGFSSSVGDKVKRAVDDCKEGVEKFTQKFKS